MRLDLTDCDRVIRFDTDDDFRQASIGGVPIYSMSYPYMSDDKGEILAEYEIVDDYDPEYDAAAWIALVDSSAEVIQPDGKVCSRPEISSLFPMES